MLNSWSQLNTNSNGEDADANDTDESTTNELGQLNYKTQYQQLKRKLKFLIFENEFFQENLRQNQERLLKITRDKNFLIDRLLKYEKPLDSTSDDESSSEEEPPKRKATEKQMNVSGANIKRRKIMAVDKSEVSSNIDDKEAMIEKLQARESLESEMMASTFSTVPQELFSNEPSLDSTYGEM
ncbi:hypothetical protein ACKWTF_014125 [Chironomus riparius]